MESQNYKESSEDETFRTKPRLLLPHIPERRFGFLHLRRSSTGRLRCRSALRSKIYSECGTASRSSRMTRCTSKKHLFPAGRKGVVFSFGARASWPTFPVSRRVALDKSEGVVKTEISWAVREHRFFAREG